MKTEAPRDALPGQELVQRGLRDLRDGRRSMEALLVAVGAPRLRRLGVALPGDDALPSCPEHRLYDLLARDDPRAAHGAYNALIRRLVSFERAMELVVRRARRGTPRPGSPRP